MAAQAKAFSIVVMVALMLCVRDHKMNVADGQADEIICCKDFSRETCVEKNCEDFCISGNCKGGSCKTRKNGPVCHCSC